MFKIQTIMEVFTLFVHTAFSHTLNTDHNYRINVETYIMSGISTIVNI